VLHIHKRCRSLCAGGRVGAPIFTLGDG
jgi:hypothetical protein